MLIFQSNLNICFLDAEREREREREREGERESTYNIYFRVKTRYFLKVSLNIRSQLFKTHDVVSLKRKSLIIKYGIYANIFAENM